MPGAVLEGVAASPASAIRSRHALSTSPAAHPGPHRGDAGRLGLGARRRTPAASSPGARPPTQNVRVMSERYPSKMAPKSTTTGSPASIGARRWAGRGAWPRWGPRPRWSRRRGPRPRAAAWRCRGPAPPRPRCRPSPEHRAATSPSAASAMAAARCHARQLARVLHLAQRLDHARWWPPARAGRSVLGPSPLGRPRDVVGLEAEALAPARARAGRRARRAGPGHRPTAARRRRSSPAAASCSAAWVR